MDLKYLKTYLLATLPPQILENVDADLQLILDIFATELKQIYSDFESKTATHLLFRITTNFESLANSFNFSSLDFNLTPTNQKHLIEFKIKSKAGKNLPNLGTNQNLFGLSLNIKRDNFSIAAQQIFNRDYSQNLSQQYKIELSRSGEETLTRLKIGDFIGDRILNSNKKASATSTVNSKIGDFLGSLEAPVIAYFAKNFIPSHLAIAITN